MLIMYREKKKKLKCITPEAYSSSFLQEGKYCQVTCANTFRMRRECATRMCMNLYFILPDVNKRAKARKRAAAFAYNKIQYFMRMS